MRVGVVGAGGAGGHFAVRWAEAGHEVTVVARGPHGRTIAEHGLTLHSPLGDAHATPEVVPRISDLADLADLDCVVFATKSFQLPQAAAEAADLNEGVVCFGLQNGVTSVSVLRDALPQARVLGATCRVISLIESPGVIRHVGADPAIHVGADDPALSDVGERIASELTVPGKLSVIASEEISREIWNKFLFFAPISGVGSVSKLTIGPLREDPRWRGMLSDAIGEVARLATAAGVPLGDDAVGRTLAFIDRLPPEGTSSLQRDIEQDRANELQDLSGRVVVMGRELGVDTPTHASIVETLTAPDSHRLRHEP